MQHATFVEPMLAAAAVRHYRALADADLDESGKPSFHRAAGAKARHAFLHALFGQRLLDGAI